ncbi:MAG: hypothetical protein PHO66_05095 [Eubacteriales bacterium]|nr:hypothetical protein [Eubacteriales bacterium]
MIKINGVPLSRQPQAVSVSYNALAAETSGRNAKGQMLIDRVAIKAKLELKWGGLTAAEAAGILSAISGVFISVTYDDLKAGAPKTITCYTGDPQMEVSHKLANGQYYYKSLSVSLIEQ